MRQQLLKEGVGKSWRRGETAAGQPPAPARIKVRWSKTGSSCPYTRSAKNIFSFLFFLKPTEA